MARKKRKRVVVADGATPRPVVTEDIAAHPRGRPAEGPVAIETNGVQTAPSRREVSVAAARIARYDGVRNGLMTGVWTLLLAAILAVLGATLGSEYDVLSNVDLPNWFSRDALTAGAIVSGVVAVIAMLGGGALGGSRGDRYHRRADAAILDTRGGGLNGGRR